MILNVNYYSLIANKNKSQITLEESLTSNTMWCLCHSVYHFHGFSWSFEIVVEVLPSIHNLVQNLSPYLDLK